MAGQTDVDPFSLVDGDGQLVYQTPRLARLTSGARRPQRIPALIAATTIVIAVFVWSTQAAYAQQVTGGIEVVMEPTSELAANSSKDLWDKLESISGIVAGVSVAIIGGVATYLYNRRQQESDKLQRGQDRAITRVKTVGEFFPHLAAGDEKIREATLVAIGVLDPELAAKLAAIYKGEGGIGALAKLAESPDREVAHEALDVLGAITDRLRESVVKVVVDVPQRYESTGFAAGPPGRLVVPNFVLPDFQGEQLAPRIVVRTFDRLEMQAYVIHRSSESLLAILGTEGSVPALPLGSTRDLNRGDALQTLFYSLEFPAGAMSTCRFDGFEDGLLRIVGLISGPGSSGAPLVDRSGRVVGVHVQRTASTVTMAEPAEAIAEALDASATSTS